MRTQRIERASLDQTLRSISPAPSNLPPLRSPEECASLLAEYIRKTRTPLKEIARETHLGIRTLQRVIYEDNRPTLKTRVAIEWYLLNHPPQGLYKQPD